MIRYQNKGGNSAIVFYEIGDDYIKIWFKDAKRTYVYSYKSAGKENVEYMKRLALEGQGLNAFIKKYVNQGYEK